MPVSATGHSVTPDTFGLVSHAYYSLLCHLKFGHSFFQIKSLLLSHCVQASQAKRGVQNTRTIRISDSDVSVKCSAV